MKTSAALIALSFNLIHLSANAQSASVIESTSRKQSYTFSNASGFSIANNGTMVYDGPLNQLTGSPCCSSATLTVNGESVTVTSAQFESDTGLSANHEGGNTLSSDLSKSTILARPEVNRIGLQYSVIVGGVTRVGVRDSYTKQEKVDSQSLSIFPQFSPSVFP